MGQKNTIEIPLWEAIYHTVEKRINRLRSEGLTKKEKKELMFLKHHLKKMTGFTFEELKKEIDK